jgi:predicted HNH restriction endonuclease
MGYDTASLTGVSSGEVTGSLTSTPIATQDDESSLPEGSVRYGWHRHLERDGALTKRVKTRRLRDTGELECDVCAFDFADNYSETGEGFIEAHHRTPVSTLRRNPNHKRKRPCTRMLKLPSYAAQVVSSNNGRTTQVPH